MFDNCETLAELNEARAKLCIGTVGDIIEVNNAYNAARQRIINERNQFIQLKPILPSVAPAEQYCGIPIAGRSSIPNCIQLTAEGFYF